MRIQTVPQAQRERALQLAWNVFLQYEAPSYSERGVESFQTAVLEDEGYQKSLIIYGAYEGDELLGMIAMRNGGNHVALFFVEGAYQGRGIGRALFEHAARESAARFITVHSGLYAVEIYHRLGFVDTAPEQETDGIRYVPMQYQKP